MIYIIIFIVVIIFFIKKNNKPKEKSVQDNWNDYFRKHPNTSIYYEPRIPQYRDNNNDTQSSNFPWKFIIFVIIALIVISKLA